MFGGLARVGGPDIYMRGDFPQIGSFQGDKPRGVGNCVSRLFRQNQTAIKKIKIQMLAIKRFKAVSCLLPVLLDLANSHVGLLILIWSIERKPISRKTGFFVSFPDLLEPRKSLADLCKKLQETFPLPRRIP